MKETNAEETRLARARERAENWQRWGPYLAERQWSTVREDYSEGGEAWTDFPHAQAHARAYRWGEDGLLGITDRECRLCFGLALWNGRDPILKERLFGLTGPQGNHGEDVKECYYYLDATPTSSYLKGLYKYPQAEYPYEALVAENARRDRSVPEFELEDTGAFAEERYFDVVAEYAKAGPDDILIRITVHNRGPEAALLHVLPQLWFRNTWSWGCRHEGCWIKPHMQRQGPTGVLAKHVTLGAFHFEAGPTPEGGTPELIFTENETNFRALWDEPNVHPFTRDAFHEYIVSGNADAVNLAGGGTKMAAVYRLALAPGARAELRLRLAPAGAFPAAPFGPEFAATFAARIAEADAFYAARTVPGATAEEQNVMRQAFAGLLWSKQFYHYIVEEWLEGDPLQPPPPEARKQGRNTAWGHLHCRDIISMPDKWEYPWFAAWDLAFHMIPMAIIDPAFAKEQLVLFLREWYMHPNGQIPAYEFQLGDVNPPVHAWACWRVYKMTGPRGKRDRVFLARVFHKLLINFTWWVNRKDPDGRNLFSGGFLGLDNIGVFDRSMRLPDGFRLEQADGTAWMAFFCATMLSMSLELASEDPAYEDVASKFFEHYVAITDAMNTLGGSGLWDEEDGFYYDLLHVGDCSKRLKVRSLVGVIPVFAVSVLEDDMLARLPGFNKRMQWFLENRKDLARHISYLEFQGTTGDESGAGGRRLLAIPSRERLMRLLHYVLDEEEFLSPHGVRSVSRAHAQYPYTFEMPGGQELSVRYVPGESDNGLFGGNSNWRGPIWFPLNYLLVEALERYHHFYGDSFQIECPIGSGKRMNLQQVADELSRRLASLFLPDATGARPCHGGAGRYAADPHWRELLLFYEYFDGDTGRGAGASHQTGWTALVVRSLGQTIRARGNGR